MPQMLGLVLIPCCVGRHSLTRSLVWTRARTTTFALAETVAAAVDTSLKDVAEMCFEILPHSKANAHLVLHGISLDWQQRGVLLAVVG
ncbi:hypothetical protein EXIGLDRAFT_737029 [Exidia glandulosa HHB12029]|uniref:Uncharacterized protein n=1 Tax=Exidia glandulosa HHB12029 TaxID=1314781 RepID=A0A165J6U8_EXIGL|nr:hypothetical protein EXIGLDRAFT_737029 [Exidia glandulosa HHB12029]